MSSIDAIDQYVVMGNPIEHSKSPVIQMAFAAQTSQSMNYGKLLVPMGEFKNSCDRFFVDGKGCNVTIPFKVDAHDYADSLTERAKRAGAVNTLKKCNDGSVLGDNTDGVGLVTDLQKNHGAEIKNKRVLVVGAGGAVSGVLANLLAERPAQLVIANRTVAKAQELANRFGEFGNITACGLSQVSAEPFDIIINGTASSLAGQQLPIPETVVDTSTWCYDMMYSPTQTPFNRWASDLGAARCIDGLGMLIEQAAEAFFLWRGVRPLTQPVIASFQ